MNFISPEIVEKTWQAMSLTPPDEFPKIINQMIAEQPIILTYLMTVGEDVYNQEEREMMLYLGVVIWKIMSQGEKPLKSISSELLDEIEEENFEHFESIENAPEIDFIDLAASFSSKCEQPEVLRYVIEALMEESETSGEIQEKNRGITMLYLKIVIDCFDRN